MSEHKYDYPLKDSFILNAKIDSAIFREVEQTTLNEQRIAVLPISELSSIFPKTIELMQQARTEIFKNFGAVHVDNIDDYFSNNDQVRHLYLLMARAIGNLNRLYGDLYDIRQKQPSSEQRVTVSQTSGLSPMHTDGSWLQHPPQAVGLLCLSTALRGGENKLIHTHQLRQAIKDHSEEFLSVLQKPYYRESASPGFTASKKHVLTSKFKIVHDCVGWSGIQYMRRWIEEGHTKAEKPLTERGIAALDYLDQALENPDLTTEIAAKKYDVIFMNNRTVLHTRNPFEDAQDDKQKRHMVRVWIDQKDQDAAYNYTR